ncbi:hypothetical protein NliqN6_2863 [Naganishia liquefaciens]|uniref:Signal recognition particle receptor subunit beta n=1 Tax=Naganishia liquefaciens TaxID=104408 RepID=A0A8H3TS65_9TREE|nr:hypothetical protein NliqN6_2863 [Naganishia liquefaciens]
MPDPLLILVALVAATFFAALILRGHVLPRVSGGAGKGVPVVALTGAPDSGKTTLFSALAFESRPKTHTSLTTSSAKVTLPTNPEASWVLLDLPGHARMRQQTQTALNNPDLRGVVFLVDIAALIRNASVVAEDLIHVLTTLTARSIRNPTLPTPHLLILATKSDLLPSATASRSTLAHDRLIALLARELDRVKAARAHTTGRIDTIERIPGSASASSNPFSFITWFFSGSATPSTTSQADESSILERAEDALWGDAAGGNGFRFENIEGVEVEFGVASAVKGQEGLTEVRDWLEGL